MPYIGYPLKLSEALRWLNLPENFVDSFHHTGPISKYLRENDSELIFEYVDKDVCILGLPLVQALYFPNMMEIDTGIQKILQLKKKVKEELRNLNVDMSSVWIAQMEEECIHMRNPDPFLCLWG
jgi:hypothetical protein